MSRSQRLRQSDQRDVFHLVGEIIELGREPARWREHLLSRLLPLIGARVGIAGEHYINPADSRDTRIVGLAFWGWSEEQEQALLAYMRAGDFASDPMHAAALRLIHRSYTRRRRDLLADEAWYASELVNQVRRNSNTDDQIYSRWRLPQVGWAHFISPMRAWGAPAFGTRERLIVSLLHRELGLLWSPLHAGVLKELPPRLGQTLDLIFNGYSEKEIAVALDVSPHTAHDFARRLYRHFGVTGRGELLASFACRQLLFRPALSPAYYSTRRRASDLDFPQPP